MAKIKMTISPAVRNRIAYLKEMRSNNPIWLRTLIQRICFVPERPIRPIPPGHRRPGPPRSYATSRAVRQAHQQSYTEWRDNFKATRPVVYWLTESIPKYYSALGEKVEDIWYNFTDWCDNYFIQRSDRWDTGVKRWDYETADELMLQVNFNQFKDFVESVFAHRYIRSMIHRAHKTDEGGDEGKKWVKIDKAASRYTLLHLKRYSNKEYALQHLHHSMALPDDEYAEKDEMRRLALVLCLYVWWTQVRPNRGESDDVSGLTEFRNDVTARYGAEDKWSYSSLTKEEQEEYRELMQKSGEIENEWAQEDTDMLVKLVKNRQNLWY